MAFTDRNQSARTDTPPLVERRTEIFVAILLVTLAATLILRGAVSPDAFAPAVATLLFGLAAASVGVAYLCRSVGTRSLLFDVAGMLTFVGVVVTIKIEPDQLVRLVSLSP